MSRNKDQLTELNHQINQCRQQSGSNLQVRWSKTFRSSPPVRSDGPHMGTARPSVTDCAWRLGPTPGVPVFTAERPPPLGSHSLRVVPARHPGAQTA